MSLLLQKRKYYKDYNMNQRRNKLFLQGGEKLQLNPNAFSCLCFIIMFCAFHYKKDIANLPPVGVLRVGGQNAPSVGTSWLRLL